ncbi:MAG: CdaR family protein, partial [Caldilineaceae bacterium]
QANPLVTQDFPERIGITVRGLDPALQPVQDLGNESVRVNLRAPRAAWDDLDAGDFTATVDLTGYSTGTQDVPIVVTVNDPRVTVLAASPPSLRIQLDPLATRTFTVSAQILDSPAFGYDWQAPIVEPPTVTVRGPATQVDLIDQLVAPVYLLNAKSQVERTVDVRPINRQNQVVDGVELSSQFANVVVPVEQWPGRKEVAVRINLVGQPSPGYRLSTVRAEPSTVVLQGIAEVLATVPGYIETEPLSIEGATTEIRTRLNLVVPPGVTVFDGNTVQAVVSITPIEGGTTVRVQPIVQGLAPAFEATVSPDTVDVILSGPVPLLESLNPDDMFV